MLWRFWARFGFFFGGFGRSLICFGGVGVWGVLDVRGVGALGCRTFSVSGALEVLRMLAFGSLGGSLGLWACRLPRDSKNPLIKEYTVNYSRIPNMI